LQPSAGVLLSGGGVRFPEGGLLGNVLGSLDKPWDDEELDDALERSFELSRARRALDAGAPAPVRLERLLLVGQTPALRRAALALQGGVPFGGLTSVESLEDALVLSAEHSFDAVLTELCLPDACGLDAVTRLRQHNVQTPIVVLVPEED